MSSETSLQTLLREVRACTHCAEELPLGPRPVLRASTTARILLVGQAPGTRVHETGVPWNDSSGDRLRDWMSVSRDFFYDEARIAIIPMGLCYPGHGRSGDLPCLQRETRRAQGAPIPGAVGSELRTSPPA